MKRDAEYLPQAEAFRPAGNSPSRKHLTLIFLLFFVFCIPIIQPLSEFVKDFIVFVKFFYNILYFFSEVWYNKRV